MEKKNAVKDIFKDVKKNFFGVKGVALILSLACVAIAIIYAARIFMLW